MCVSEIKATLIHIILAANFQLIVSFKFKQRKCVKVIKTTKFNTCGEINMKLQCALLCAAAFFSANSVADSLKVMAYNIMQLNLQDWDQTNRAQRLPNVISNLNDSPDVI